MSAKKLQIVIIDDHTLFRDGLEGLLKHRDIKVTASVGTGREGIELAQQLKPNVVLLDLRMPDMHGLDVIKRLITEGFTAPVVILTTSNDENDLVDAFTYGAKGYLLKDMEPDDLVAALREIDGGKVVVAPALHNTYMQVQRGHEPIKMRPLESLTPREREIVVFLADGLSNKAIAKQLGIADGTVKLHVKQILRKLNVRSRVEAAVIAVECGVRSRHDN